MSKLKTTTTLKKSQTGLKEKKKQAKYIQEITRGSSSILWKKSEIEKKTENKLKYLQCCNCSTKGIERRKKTNTYAYTHEKQE